MSLSDIDEESDSEWQTFYEDIDASLAEYNVNLFALDELNEKLNTCSKETHNNHLSRKLLSGHLNQLEFITPFFGCYWRNRNDNICGFPYMRVAPFATPQSTAPSCLKNEQDSEKVEEPEDSEDSLALKHLKLQLEQQYLDYQTWLMEQKNAGVEVFKDSDEHHAKVHVSFTLGSEIYSNMKPSNIKIVARLCSLMSLKEDKEKKKRRERRRKRRRRGWGTCEL